MNWKKVQRFFSRGLGAFILVFGISIAAFLLWPILVPPPKPGIPTYTEGQEKSPYIQTVNVVLKDGTMLKCFKISLASDYSISCDWANAVNASKR